MEAEIATKEELVNKALAAVNQAKDIIIISKDDYEFCDLCYKEIKSWINRLDDEEKKITRPILEGLENARAFFRTPKQKASEVKEILNNRMVGWVQEEKRKEQEEQKRLEEEARKRAEEEAIQAALEAEEAGEKEEAEQILAEPIYVPPVKVASQIPKSKGTHIRETWSAEPFDLMATIKAIAAGKAPIEAVEYNRPFLNSQATRYKERLLEVIAGVRAIPKRTQV